MIEQTAGNVTLTAWTDGSPTAITLKIDGGGDADVRIGVSTLHDLQYCIARILAQLPPADANHMRR